MILKRTKLLLVLGLILLMIASCHTGRKQDGVGNNLVDSVVKRKDVTFFSLPIGKGEKGDHPGRASL